MSRGALRCHSSILSAASKSFGDALGSSGKALGKLGELLGEETGALGKLWEPVGEEKGAQDGGNKPALCRAASSR